MLTGPEIEKRICEGDIVIDPFDPKHVGPNSCDLTLSDSLLVYDRRRCQWVGGELGMTPLLDMATENPTESVTIPESGLILMPGTLYLGSTVERVGSNCFVPCIEGRSSIGRLGIQIHATAGFGDLGFLGNFTLEISVIQPVRVYPGVRICQVAFTRPEGAIRLYRGKYLNQSGPVPSGIWREFS